MRRAVAKAGLGVCLVVIGLLAGCAESSPPTAPSPASQPNSAPTPPTPPAGQPRLTHIGISGPSQVAPGETVGLIATANFSDGSSRDVTGDAQWSSSNESAFSVTAPGYFTARALGEAEARATFDSMTNARSLMAIPPGTRFVRGTVTDGHRVIMPIADARVEVISGPSAGLTATTSFGGGFGLYGVPAQFQIRVIKDGFMPVVESVDLVNAPGHYYIQLYQATDRVDLTGTYRLTIGGGPCAAGGGPFPEALRTRTYTAVVRHQDVRSVTVELSGAQFLILTSRGGPGPPHPPRGDRFHGEARVKDAQFRLGAFGPAEWYWGIGPTYPDVIEQVPEGLVAISGTAVVAVTPNGLSGTLNGSFSLFDALNENTVSAKVSCDSTTHQFTMVR